MSQCAACRARRRAASAFARTRATQLGAACARAFGMPECDLEGAPLFARMMLSTMRPAPGVVGAYGGDRAMGEPWGPAPVPPQRALLDELRHVDPVASYYLELMWWYIFNPEEACGHE